jgi:D-glycero-D-manno-heptose 1,7-bisphosphate phosphatase
VLNRRAVFLDRDGVLNRTAVLKGKPYAPRDFKSFELLPDALPSSMMLHNAGLLIIVITNQPDVGNGLVSKSVVEEMHNYLRKTLPIDAIKVCYHGQSANCECRKPNTALMTEASKEMNFELAKSFMVGDRWSDIKAGRSLGCYTIFIDRGYKESLQDIPDATVSSLTEAVGIIMSNIPDDKTRRGNE